MSRFNTELKSDSDSEAESKSGTELMAKLKSDSDSKQIILLLKIFTHSFCWLLTSPFTANDWIY